MELTGDQNATLQLLLVRGQRYEDLATVLAVDEAEIRARARAALTELGGADPDRNVGLTDYLLGQADPIGRADASRHLRQDPEDHALATTLAERLRELFPDAELPRLPGDARPAGPLRRRAATREPGPLRRRLGGGPDLSQPQTRLIVILTSAAVILIAAVLGITGAFSGDEDSSSATADTTTSTTPADERAVPVQLQPRNGSDAGGVVVFGFATADQPFIEFQVRKLEPPTNDKAYVLWFLTGRQGFPLPTPLPVQANGILDQRIAVPPEILAFVQRADSIAIALNDRAQLNRDIRAAIQNNAGALRYPGGTVLSASIRGATGGGSSPG